MEKYKCYRNDNINIMIDINQVQKREKENLDKCITKLFFYDPCEAFTLFEYFINTG